MSNVALKFAVSSLVLAMTTVACKPAADMARPASLSAKAPRADQEAAKLFTKAENALRQGDLALALTHTENAVELSPRDVGYRMLLADLYLKNGRFIAAESTFADVLTLNPDNRRAALNLVLVEVALGKNQAALSRLDGLVGTASPSDIGLAYALAGEPQRAIELLEPAARAPEANARIRQNLALAFALAGDWKRARTTAAQDISPADVEGRLQQWAAFAHPADSWTQVASLLGVTPVEDAGQPVRLALAPAASDAVQFAQAEEVRPLEPVPAPVQAAAQPPAETFASVEAAPEVTEVAEALTAVPAEIQPEPAAPVVQYAEAVQSLVAPQPVLIRASASTAVASAPLPAFVPARKAPRIAGRTERAEQERAVVSAKAGRFVVQLGAYRSDAAVERAWAQAQRRYPLASQRTPLSTTVSIPGKGTFYRLSVSGFGTATEAARLCGTIRAKGGACFVRATAGDAPLRWASRSARRG